jgi:hypothetical protein
MRKKDHGALSAIVGGVRRAQNHKLRVLDGFVGENPAGPKPRLQQRLAGKRGCPCQYIALYHLSFS